jgi:hypothetical protein
MPSNSVPKREHYFESPKNRQTLTWMDQVSELDISWRMWGKFWRSAIFGEFAGDARSSVSHRILNGPFAMSNFLWMPTIGPLQFFPSIFVMALPVNPSYWRIFSQIRSQFSVVSTPSSGSISYESDRLYRKSQRFFLVEMSEKKCAFWHQQSIASNVAAKRMPLCKTQFAQITISMMRDLTWIALNASRDPHWATTGSELKEKNNCLGAPRCQYRENISIQERMVAQEVIEMGGNQ